MECPECKNSWDGGDIFEEQKIRDWWKKTMSELDLKKYLIECYGENKHYSKLIGITDILEDHVGRLRCPFCKTEWDRITEKKIK